MAKSKQPIVIRFLVESDLMIIRRNLLNMDDVLFESGELIELKSLQIDKKGGMSEAVFLPDKEYRVFEGDRAAIPLELFELVEGVSDAKEAGRAPR